MAVNSYLTQGKEGQFPSCGSFPHGPARTYAAADGRRQSYRKAWGIGSPEGCGSCLRAADLAFSISAGLLLRNWCVGTRASFLRLRSANTLATYVLVSA